MGVWSNSTQMTRVGLTLLLIIEIIFAWQRAVAANPSDGNVDAIPQSPPAVVTNVAQLRALTRADLNRGRPVSLTGTVTLVDAERKRLVLQDAAGAVVWYSDQPVDAGLAGKLVRLDCSKAWSYAVTFPDFPDKPSGADVRTSFEAPSNWGDYHLTRMAAYLHPPKSGEYTFWIASDDSSELWLSTDADPTGVRKIASVMEGLWTDPHEWDRFPSQRSESVQLRAGGSYYIEAFQEQGLLNDHLSVAWEGPGIARSVIPGECLTPWVDNEHGQDRNPTIGVLREYWTNYAVGSVVPITPGGPAGAALAGRDATFQVLGPGTQPKPQNVQLAELLAAENNYRWIQTEGTITFASTDGEGATLELAAGTRRASVHIAKWNQVPPQAGQNWRARVQGVCEGVADAYEALNVGFIWVPTSENVRLLKGVTENKEAVAAPDAAQDSTPGFGGYYTARGAVTFDGRVSGRRYLYVQDIHGSVSVSDADRVCKNLFEVGQWVQVGGTLSPGKAGLQLVPMTIRLLGWQSLPLPAELGEDAAYRDGQWTQMEGIVRSIRPDGALKVKGPGGFVSVWSPAIPADECLVDSTVRFRGVVSLDSMGAPLLLVGSRQFVHVEEQGSKDPFAQTSRSIRDLDNLPVGTARVHRVKVEGTVTYADEGTVFVQDSSGAVRFQAAHARNFHPGDRIQLAGFPDAGGSLRVLAEPELRVAGTGPEVKPTEINLNDAFADMNGNLVAVHGTLLAEKSRGSIQVLELQSGQRVFDAVLATNKGALPALATGSLLKIVGVCVAELIPAPGAKSGNWENSSMASLQILLRAPADIVVRSGPPWWTARKVAALISFLLVVLSGSLLWMHLQGRRYERRQLAQLEFSRQILKSQEAERHRIAANLHDSLGQNLLVIKNLAVLAMQPAPDTRGTFERLDAISGMASQVIEEVRQITHDLRPSQLERVGLTQTLRGTIRKVSENCAIEFASHVDEVDGLFDNDGEIHIYRILQEALNNIVKHSGATEATVVVRREATSFVMVVRDNGRGFADAMADGMELSRAGFGLSGIDERARILRGTAIFDSRPGQGFRLTVEIPLTRRV